ncbi:HAMP domain-containing sensor histidine kinase [Sphingomonas sp.]|uniref:sensor histidine kinase n=1 Tax=Sphingomonas sp. TaxID=28214 RepID=UPI0031D94DBA
MIGLSLAVAGGAAGLASSYGLWLALAGALLAIAWLILSNLETAGRPIAMSAAPTITAEREEAIHRMLLDASPTPLLLVDGTVVRALNRAARRLFATDDRVLPAPTTLLDHDATHLRHAGRSWRADRVDVGARVVIALIDVEGEERTAEARASAEMIQVLGHEMLNGLVPIVSLAECGLAAAEAKDGDPELLAEILTTLARRAEGLQRFTEAYRSLARLPPPMKQPVDMGALIADLERLFAVRWPEAVLTVAIPRGLTGMIDRDQLNQAIWALLQNAVEAAGAAALVDLSVMRQEGALSIDITDNGPGVPPEQASVIFRPFATTKASGTGIGLSLARQIAQAHGGTLNLLALTPATFRLRLPDGSPHASGQRLQSC